MVGYMAILVTLLDVFDRARQINIPRSVVSLANQPYVKNLGAAVNYLRLAEVFGWSAVFLTAAVGTGCMVPLRKTQR